MALHNYAADVLGSKTSVRVLRVLWRYRGKVFTVRELSVAAGVSHPQASAVLKELERRGVVRLQPVGRAYQVSLNEDSYIVRSIIEPIFSAENETMSSMISSIRPFFDHPRILSAAIFGSVARGEEGATSDVDLLIVTEDRGLANERAAGAMEAVLPRFGHGLSPLILPKERFIRDRDGELAKSILGSYAMVCGEDLKELVQSGKTGR
jgi:predicted nucleotidyltransferase